MANAASLRRTRLVRTRARPSVDRHANYSLNQAKGRCRRGPLTGDERTMTSAGTDRPNPSEILHPRVSRKPGRFIPWRGPGGSWFTIAIGPVILGYATGQPRDAASWGCCVDSLQCQAATGMEIGAAISSMETERSAVAVFPPGVHR